MTFNQKRGVVAVFLAIALLSAGNAVFGWGIFQGYQRQLVIASFCLLAIAIKYFGPSIAEISAYRRREGE